MLKRCVFKSRLKTVWTDK